MKAFWLPQIWECWSGSRSQPTAIQCLAQCKSNPQLNGNIIIGLFRHWCRWVWSSIRRGRRKSRRWCWFQLRLRLTTCIWFYRSGPGCSFRLLFFKCYAMIWPVQLFYYYLLAINQWNQSFIWFKRNKVNKIKWNKIKLVFSIT